MTFRAAGVRKRRALLPALAVLTACVVSACGSSHAPAPSPTASQTASSAPPSESPTDKVVVHVPARHGGIGVVALHSLEHGADEPIRQGWSKAADRYGFVAIYPTRGADWNAGLCCGAAMAANRDDVGWLTDEIHAAAAKYHLTSIYLVGDSNGGMMVERLVAERPDIAKRFAVWGAAPEWTTPSRWDGTGYLFHGEVDRSVPVAGGTVRLAGRLIHINPASETRRLLPDAHLIFITVPKLGHVAPITWPDIAWNALQSGIVPAALGHLS